MARFSERPLHLPARDGIPEETLVLRSCAPGEAHLFEPFWNVVSRETTHTMQTPECPPNFSKTAEFWGKTLEDPFEVRVGAFQSMPDGTRRLVGQIGFHRTWGSDHPWVRHAGEFGMMVRREFWGRGVGRALIAAMEEHARSIGVVKIEAIVRAENERGWRLYESCGYRIEGTRKRAVKIDGRFQDEYWIAKDLD